MQEREQFPAWVRSPEQTAAHYGVNLETGLTSQQVEEQRQKYGYNELEKAPGKPLWKLVLEQFDDMLVKVIAQGLLTVIASLEHSQSWGVHAQPRVLTRRVQCRFCCWQQ